MIIKMKNSVLTIILMLAWAMGAQAQILGVTSIERLNIKSEKGQVMQAVAVSPQGDYVLLSSDTRQGLVKWDLATERATKLTDKEGTGSDVRISQDGQQVIYSETSFKNKRRRQSVKSIDLKTGKHKTLAGPARGAQGYDNGTGDQPVLTHRHLKLYMTRNGETTLLAPNGPDEHYIWASLSPSASRVLYYVSGHGAFVCDLDGSHVVAMGNLTAPRWWDDETIVGMDEVDNEYVIVASKVVARTLDGRTQVLTGDDVVATYPLPSAQSGKIIFSTPDGHIHLIKID